MLEYKGYTPDKIKRDKFKNTMLIAVVALVAVLMLIFLVFNVKNSMSVEVENIKDISYKSIDSETEYYFEDVVLIDQYATVEDKGTGVIEMRDFIVNFVDKDGQLVYTTIRTERTDYNDFTTKCELYIYDEKAKIGDVILEGCFHGYKNGSQNKKTSYFMEAYEICNSEMPGEILDWTFYYDAETVEEFREDKASGAMVTAIICGVITVLCGVGIFFLTRKRKELNSYLAETSVDDQNQNLGI